MTRRLAWLTIVLAMPAMVSAQLIRAPLDRGFVRTSSISMSVDEMLGAQKTRSANEPILGPGYPDLWIAEVQFKPVRYRRMEVTDPGSGTRSRELVWYMVYRIIQRDYTELAGDSRDNLVAKLVDTQQPQNAIDPKQRYPIQIPRFILRTDDDPQNPEYYVDEVNLEIQQEVLQREFRRSQGQQLLNSVQAIGEVTDPVSADDPDPLAKAQYGVAVWRHVNPTTDYFTVTMMGFCNAYRISTVDGKTVVEHKVIEQRFARPGDEFNQREDEFRIIDAARLTSNDEVQIISGFSEESYRPGRPAPAFVGALREQLEALRASGSKPELFWPNWQYQPRPATVDVPDFQRILRNAKNGADLDQAAQ